MNKALESSRYQAIDPMALVLPPSVYAKLIEGRYPHVPLTDVIDKAVASLTTEDRRIVLERSRTLIRDIQVVEKAIERTK